MPELYGRSQLCSKTYILAIFKNIFLAIPQSHVSILHSFLNESIFFIALYTEDMKLYRKIAVIASILWIIYNIAVHAYVSVFDYTIELISSLIAIYRFDIKKERENAREKDKIKKLK